MNPNSIAGDDVDQSWVAKIIAERENRDYTNVGAPPGTKFNPAALRAASHFAPYLHTGHRLKVRTTYLSGEEFVRTGTVGITTGWQPHFLLMHRSNASGSSDVLSADDEIIATWNGRTYEPVKKASEFA